MSLLQQGTSVWAREEALGAVIDSMFVELPATPRAAAAEAAAEASALGAATLRSDLARFVTIQLLTFKVGSCPLPVLPLPIFPLPFLPMSPFLDHPPSLCPPHSIYPNAAVAAHPPPCSPSPSPPVPHPPLPLPSTPFTLPPSGAAEGQHSRGGRDAHPHARRVQRPNAALPRYQRLPQAHPGPISDRCPLGTAQWCVWGGRVCKLILALSQTGALSALHNGVCVGGGRGGQADASQVREGGRSMRGEGQEASRGKDKMCVGGSRRSHVLML